MFEYDEEGGRWDAMHHPFTAPVGDMADPGSLRSRGYDFVLDGSEIGGGSIRIHRPEVQQQVFKALGISEQEAEERFGFLLDALRYGAPPHGGIALGIDRLAALIGGRDSIREVIAFPKAASGADPLTGAPGRGRRRAAARARLQAARAAAAAARGLKLPGRSPACCTCVSSARRTARRTRARSWPSTSA